MVNVRSRFTAMLYGDIVVIQTSKNRLQVHMAMAHEIAEALLRRCDNSRPAKRLTLAEEGDLHAIAKLVEWTANAAWRQNHPQSVQPDRRPPLLREK